MRTIGVVPELGIDPGVYCRSSINQTTATTTWNTYQAQSFQNIAYGQLLLYALFPHLMVFFALFRKKTPQPIIRLPESAVGSILDRI